MDVGDDGMEAGDLEPPLEVFGVSDGCGWRGGEAESRAGLDVTCRRSVVVWCNEAAVGWVSLMVAD